MAILLVRHAQPEAVADVDPRRWALSDAGRSAARSLAGRLPGAGVWLSSTEVKAYETLLYAGHGVGITQDERFDEVRRREPFADDYRTRRLAWVEGQLDERHIGWETPQEVAERFDLAVADLATGVPVVIASHGMAITAWLVHARRCLAQREAGRFWDALTLPDIVEVDAARS